MHALSYVIRNLECTKFLVYNTYSKNKFISVEGAYATENVVKGTVRLCFYPSKDQLCSNYCYPSRECVLDVTDVPFGL